MWYGRLPHTTIRSPRHRAAIARSYFIASIRSTSTFSTVPSSPRSTSIMSGSRSSAITLPSGTRSASRAVNVPSPAPISTIQSSSAPTAASTIARNTRSAIKKFWPNDFFARRP